MKTLLFLITLTFGINCFAGTPDREIKTTKQERNFICEGNRQFAQKNYAEAEVAYRKALEASPGSPLAQFNLATALLMQAGNQPSTPEKQEKNDPVQQAANLLTNLAINAPTRDLRSKANYDLGNLAFADEQYAQAVELYKQALRENPNDDQARYNLRLAQLKLRDQQNNQNKNQDKNKDQNKDQNQDQNKDKNQDQNKDQNKDPNKDKNQKQDQNQDNNKNNNDNKSQPQQQGQMSAQNAEQVLKAMQNQENATKQKVERIQAQEQQRERNRTNRKW